MTRAYFAICLALGRLLRSVRYSTVRHVEQDGEHQVQKSRAFFAPPLIRLGNLVMAILGTGVRILPQKDWEARERAIYLRLSGAAIRTRPDGTLVLPHLTGRTLASVLDDRATDDSARAKAIQRAVAALAALHRLGYTHGDAMAENVLVDADVGAARWFDFETVHDARRPATWRQADDLRALLATCLIRTVPSARAEALQCVLDVYADERVTRILAASFAAGFRRPLAFHLAQAPMSWQSDREIGRLLEERLTRRAG